MKFKKLLSFTFASALIVTGALTASASPVNSSTDTLQNIQNAVGSYVTIIESFNASIYPTVGSCPAKVPYNNGSEGGWLYRIDSSATQSNGYWYIQYAGTIYPY
jgi:hypothetical protein